MSATPQHIYQVLTKRAKRLAELSGLIEWPDNTWVGPITCVPCPFSTRSALVADHIAAFDAP